MDRPEIYVFMTQMNTRHVLVDFKSSRGQERQQYPQNRGFFNCRVEEKKATFYPADANKSICNT